MEIELTGGYLPQKYIDSSEAEQKYRNTIKKKIAKVLMNKIIEEDLFQIEPNGEGTNISLKVDIKI